MIRFCDKCKQKCNKTLFGTFVILCKDNITLCMDCNSFRFFKEKNNLLNFLKFNLNLTIFNLSNKIIYPLINFLGFIDTKNAIYFGTKKVSSLNSLSISY